MGRTFVDALGRSHEFARSPERIVSLVPSLTEALFAFGAGERVAGVTRYCVEPADGVASKRKVGGTKNVDIGGVSALSPDLVLANVEENTRDDVQALEAAGLCVFLTYARTVAEAIDELRTIAAITDTAKTAAPIMDDAAAELRAAEEGKGDRLPTFCPIWRNPWMTVNRDTYINDVLRLVGAANVYADAADRYPTIELGDVAEKHPALVLLPDEPYKFGAKHVPEVSEQLGDVRIRLVDGKMLCWYGPRIAESLRRLRAIVREEAVP